MCVTFFHPATPSTDLMEDNMKLLDIKREICAGCRLCEFVCSLSHEGECGTSKSAIKIVRDEEFGNNVISVCQQCAEPLCVDSCTYGNITRNPDTGIVSIDDRLCTGCGDCLSACPVSALSLNKDKGIAFKCDLCNGDPECAKICPREAVSLKEIDPASPDRKALLTETSNALRNLQNMVKHQ